MRVAAACSGVCAIVKEPCRKQKRHAIILLASHGRQYTTRRQVRQSPGARCSWAGFSNDLKKPLILSVQADSVATPGAPGRFGFDTAGATQDKLEHKFSNKKLPLRIYGEVDPSGRFAKSSDPKVLVKRRTRHPRNQQAR